MNRKMEHPVSMTHTLILALGLIFFQASSVYSKTIKLQNPELNLWLDIDTNGFPFIKRITWRENGDVILSSQGCGSGFQDWLTREFPSNLERNTADAGWIGERDRLFQRAKASWRSGPLEVINHIALARDCAVIKIYMEIVNHGTFTRIDSFPIWFAELTLPATNELHYWNVLNYKPQRAKLISSYQTVFQSKT